MAIRFADALAPWRRHRTRRTRPRPIEQSDRQARLPISHEQALRPPERWRCHGSATDAEISLDLPWDVRHGAGIRAALEYDLPPVSRDTLQSVHAIEGPHQAPRGGKRADDGVPMVGSCESHSQTRGGGSGVPERLDDRRFLCGCARDGRADGYCRKRDRGGANKTDQRASVAHVGRVKPPRETVAWSFAPAHLAAEIDIGVKGRAMFVGMSRRGCSLLAVASVDRCARRDRLLSAHGARQARFSSLLTRSSASRPSRDARRRTGRPILRRETRV
jgi:hypothetical protein